MAALVRRIASMEDLTGIGNDNAYFMELNLLKNKNTTHSIVSHAESLYRARYYL